MTTALQQLSSEMADVVDGVRRSLVEIRDGRRGAGAGSIWHSDGLVLTNAHVVESRVVRVTLPDGREVDARVMAHDRGLDLAALAVEAEGLPSVPLGDSKHLQPGELVFAMGHPWGVTGATSAGVVIDVGVPLDNAPPVGREWVVASLRLRPGHSGGPMMDSRGRLVGINTMITGPEVAMAVPVHVAKAFLVNALESSRAA